MNKVGIMGGTFNPVHLGHLALAEEARQQLGLDEVLFIPTYKPPHKNPNDIVSAKDRLEMLRLAVEDNIFFKVSDMEISRGGTTYSVDTLEELKHRMPECEFYFILGSDSILSVDKWREPEKLFKLCRFAAAVRPGFEDKSAAEDIKKLGKRYNSRIICLEAVKLDISSTEIRNRIAGGVSFRYLMPEKSAKYITDNELYGFKPEFYPEASVFIKRLEKELKPSRFIHTMGVAHEARRLAAKWGEDRHKAYIAGLLHDCAKNFPPEKTFALCDEYGIELDEVLKTQPDLIHSFLGAEMAKRDYGIGDSDILNAIKYHTTGREAMSRLELIIYLADMTEPNRAFYDGLDKIRELTYYDLEYAAETALRQTIEFNSEKGRLIHPLSLKAYSYYKNKLKNRRKNIE